MKVGTFKVPHICNENVEYAFASLPCFLTMVNGKHTTLTEPDDPTNCQNNGEIKGQCWDKTSHFTGKTMTEIHRKMRLLAQESCPLYASV